MFGDAVGLGVLRTRSLIFWNNGLDASPTESSEAVAALAQMIQCDNVILILIISLSLITLYHGHRIAASHRGLPLRSQPRRPSVFRADVGSRVVG